jgi:hypothetical protein
VEEILKLLRSQGSNHIVNLAGLPPSKRSACFAELMPHLGKLRAQTGQPHWIAIEEARSAWAAPDLPTSNDGALSDLYSVLQITEHPNLIAPSVLRAVDLLIATGNSPVAMIREFCEASDTPMPHMDPINLKSGEALAWRPRHRDIAPLRLNIEPTSRV